MRIFDIPKTSLCRYDTEVKKQLKHARFQFTQKKDFMFLRIKHVVVQQPHLHADDDDDDDSFLHNRWFYCCGCFASNYAWISSQTQ